MHCEQSILDLLMTNSVRSQRRPSLPGTASLQGGCHESTTHVPLGSLGGPDGITPQHMRDLLAGCTHDSLQQALVDFLNLMIAGAFDREKSYIIFGDDSSSNIGILPQKPEVEIWRPKNISFVMGLF